MRYLLILLLLTCCSPQKPKEHSWKQEFRSLVRWKAPAWMHAQITKDLAPFKKYTAGQLESFWQEQVSKGENPDGLYRYTIQKNKISVTTFGKETLGQRGGGGCYKSLSKTCSAGKTSRYRSHRCSWRGVFTFRG